MRSIHQLARPIIIVILTLGLVTSFAGITNARAAIDTHVTGNDAFAQNDDLVDQLVQVLIQILDDLLNPGDDLEDLLPAGCNVEDGGFSCDITSGDASLFLSETCEPSIFNDDVYLCPVASVVYSCNIYGPTSVLICIAS